MATTHYDLITGASVADLAAKVTTAIAAGWEPSGPPLSIASGEFAQQVIKINAALAGIGAVPAGVTAVEVGDSVRHVTRLSMTNFALGNSADAAALALGALIYTFPTGVIVVNYTAFNAIAVTLADAVQTDTPEVGLGNLIGSGANATLGAVGATAENIRDGVAIGAVDGVSVLNGVKFPTAGVPLTIAAAAEHGVWFNLAATWADLTAAAALTVTGEVVIDWTRLA